MLSTFLCRYNLLKRCNRNPVYMLSSRVNWVARGCHQKVTLARISCNDNIHQFLNTKLHFSPFPFSFTQARLLKMYAAHYITSKLHKACRFLKYQLEIMIIRRNIDYDLYFIGSHEMIDWWWDINFTEPRIQLIANVPKMLKLLRCSENPINYSSYPTSS